MTNNGELMNIYTKSNLENALSSDIKEKIDIIDCGISIYELAIKDATAALEDILGTISAAGELDRKYRQNDPARHTKAAPHKAVAVLINADASGSDLDSFPPYQQAMNNLFSNLRTIVQSINSENIWLLIENPAEKLLVSPLEIRDLVDKLQSPWLGVYFNSDNINNTIAVDDYINILGSRIYKSN